MSLGETRIYLFTKTTFLRCRAMLKLRNGTGGKIIKYNLCIILIFCFIFLFNPIIFGQFVSYNRAKLSFDLIVFNDLVFKDILFHIIISIP